MSRGCGHRQGGARPEVGSRSRAAVLGAFPVGRRCDARLPALPELGWARVPRPHSANMVRLAKPVEVGVTAASGDPAGRCGRRGSHEATSLVAGRAIPAVCWECVVVHLCSSVARVRSRKRVGFLFCEGVRSSGTPPLEGGYAAWTSGRGLSRGPAWTISWASPRRRDGFAAESVDRRGLRRGLLLREPAWTPAWTAHQASKSAPPSTPHRVVEGVLVGPLASRVGWLPSRSLGFWPDTFTAPG